MFQDNPLLAQLKLKIKETIPKKEGTVKATEKGFGFLEVDNNTSYFIPPPYMKKVMHGDKVVALIRTEKEKEVAEPDELLEQNLHRFIGRVKIIRGKLNVVPDNPQLKDAIRAKTCRGLSHDALAEGDWVVAHLIQHPLKGDNHFFCEIAEKITDAEDKIAPWWVTLAKHDLPNKEPVDQASWDMLDENLTRQDLTALPFITIDNESTKDMDDALHTLVNSDGTFSLTIAIADPTAYIAQNSDLDLQARKRGFTIYLPGRNIPMLPRGLSDNLCSLREEEIRPVLCCRVTVQPDGLITDDAHFFVANIKSQGRLSYDNVSNYIENTGEQTWHPNDVIAEQINALHGLANARIVWREKNAVTFPDRPDYRFELSEDNDVLAIHADVRRIANRMVEETMITANICAGRMLSRHFGFGVFNTHMGLVPEKIADVVALINENGGTTTLETLATIDGFSALRRWLNAQETSYLDNRIRKCQSYSEISNKPAPHFAMGLDVYATWTSPIRKYGDMINHRLLKAMIRDETKAQAPDDTLGEELGLHRKYHRIAERDIADWLYVRLLQKDLHAKTLFKGEVFDVNRAGMRVKLLENGAMTFVPGSMIMDNKERISCHADVGMIMIDGEKAFQIGDEIDVILTEIKETTRSIISKPTREFAAVAQKIEINVDVQESSEEK